ncbi:hypothetical protein RB195_006571 [Necator americanus]|uniref:Transmembrane protein 254 n=1 Tax=Necator americanus TaxID=51031 RepID=A0ABR1BT94_NECAM
MPDYFRSPPLFWWIIILPALGINFLAYYSPLALNGFLPIIGPIVAHIGTSYHWITVITNLFALIAHVGEGLYAFYLSRNLKFSTFCSIKWFAQTFAVGFPSLSILTNFARKHIT